ncbi:LOG family protein [Hydrogenimonas thermophila]|uniref:LOG family protein n=1 Tax=Hydrogenimonas thermophila TaxID=223786 RepID=UPI00293746E8|nr:LOG family protein [Hydrogenimonas thermophila]WOE69309.1 LOG family protein [Hydrogenimonas thermophila]WOE71819.1 LOG family protein [Hydrogenimonas thermophila]
MRKKDSSIHSEFPWEHPKSKSEDPKAVKLVKRLMESPTYRLAEDDPDFMKSYEARGVRLEIDYLKAELAMQKLGIKHTIVVFGSARIKERKTAMSELKEIQKKIEAHPENKELLEQLRIAERMVEKSIYYDDARMFGRYIGESGKGPDDSRVVLMTGGGPGIMEAANRGSYDVGARSIGLNIRLPHEQFPNPYITPELCFQFRYFAIRKLHFFLRSKALVVYPGGFGTLDELFEILTLVQTQKTNIIPVVMVGKKYWKKAIDFDFLKEEGVITSQDLEIFKIVENATEAWKYILDWHKHKDTHLFI